ncbi:thermonuclease family protein [Alkalihalobacillus sp. MEB130]|uniref:thermonuclease family protein n=1 Tax=Alkalihalobacillus sp. MEB130 TaxID=2976704 RepID=UPI0028E0956C|nr:thermonuclease family protein [Alkalihalobacillus sp. MEB130]MDT8858859.1 thermonuclease family protein [Alkalihalobacillus sp. MEB130]
MFRYKWMLIIFVIGLSACSPAENQAPPLDLIAEDAPFLDSDWILASVENVVDGDTIRITDLNVDYVTDPRLVGELEELDTSSVRVRFLAVDTPEDTTVKQLYGRESTELVKELLDRGLVVIEIDENADFDRYDRLLGHIFTVDGVNVQEALLREGLARVAYLYDDYRYVDNYFMAEEAAKAEGLNVHSIEGYVTERGFDMSVVE